MPRRRRAAPFLAAGFQEPERAASTWRSLRDRLPASSSFRQLWPETWADLVRSADPDLALGTWSRWVEAGLDAGSPNPDRPGDRAETWGTSRRFRRGFVVVCGISSALGEFLLNAWEDFRPDSWQTGWETHESLTSRLRERVDGVDEKTFLLRTRHFRSVELLRIAYLDCLENVPVHQVTLQISAVADVLVQCCLERAMADIGKRTGLRASSEKSGLCVLALGKLGGRELNYSSDIDLNFIRDENVVELARRSGEPARQPAEIETYYRLVVERLVALISTFAGTGPLYRLDTRLRPEGSSGRLVWTSRAALNYYYSVGRPWEKQALIRMRPIAGDRELAARFVGELESFMFPATFSNEDVRQIRGLKLQVEKIAASKGDQDRQIKIGQGGIRDVEYIVQYLQLFHGHRLPALRAANVFGALEALERESLLAAEEADALRRGYRFIRRVEHHVQLAHMLQKHDLPEDPRELRRLARGLRFDDVDAFRAKLSEHTAAIRRVYGLLFEEATAERPAEEQLPALLDLPPDSVAEEGARLVAPYGFQDTAKAFQRLRALAGEGKRLVDASHSKEMFGRLVVKLLKQLSRQPEPDRALSNFEDIVRSLGARSVFYQLLDESDELLELFVELCARSSLVIEILRYHPDVLDEVVDALVTGYTFNPESMQADVERIVEVGENIERELFDFKYSHLLMIAIRDLRGVDTARATMLHISGVAEALLRGLVARSRQRAVEKLGAWEGEEPRFLVLGLGKLGGREMTYRSDLDIVCVYDCDDPKAKTSRGIRVQEYFDRFFQIVLETSKIADTQGSLMEIDVRLRPLGSHNSLVVSLDALRRYFLEGPAETWERQAFLRARTVAGDAELGREALDFIRSELLQGGNGARTADAAVKADMWKMRQKIQKHAGKDDLKRGVGGIVDVEFIVQGLQLIHGREHPEILDPSTAESLLKLQDAGLLRPAEGIELSNSYRFLRWIENRFALVGEPGQSIQTMDEKQLDSVAQKIGYRSTGEEPAVEIFRAELAYHRKKVREALLRVLGVDEPK